MRFGILLGCAILLIASCASAQSPSSKPRVIKLSSSFPAKTSLGVNITEFRIALGQRLAGEFKIETVAPPRNELEALRRGEIDLAIIGSSAISAQRITDSRFQDSQGLALFDLPFFFKNLEEVKNFQDGSAGQAILGSLGAHGVVGLGFWNGGLTQLFGKPVPDVGSLKGLKLGTGVSPQGQMVARELGIVSSELSLAMLDSGAVDAVEVPPHYVENGVFSIFKGTVSELNYRPVVAVVIANQAFWRSLTSRVQATLTLEVRTMAERATAQASSLDKSALTKLTLLSRTAIKPDALPAFRRGAEPAWRAVKELTESGALQDALKHMAQTTSPQLAGGQVKREPREYKPMQVFFATDRQEERDRTLGFAGKRGGGKTNYGYIQMVVDKNRSNANRALTSPGEPIVLLSKEGFQTNLAESLKNSDRKEVLVYLHGFYNSFLDAASNAAVLANDIRLDGAIVIFSWPSARQISLYPNDEDEVTASSPHFIEFLTTVRTVPGLLRLSVLAHSMGSRLVADALKEIEKSSGGDHEFLNHIILAAPDIYTVHLRNAASSMALRSKRVTLYASENDNALTCSKTFHGKNPRAGLGGKQIVIVGNVDTLDATPVEPAGLISVPCLSGHSYVTGNRTVLDDLYDLMINDIEPKNRTRLQPAEKEGQRYWVFQR